MTTDKQVSKTFTIGELARQLNITTRTIRYYEERGLLMPQRTNGGQRIYTRKDRGHLKLMLQAKTLGLPLKDIKELIQIYDAEPTPQGEQKQLLKAQELLTDRLTQIEYQIAELTELHDSLKERLTWINTHIKS